jgi:hypothetical protein
VRSIIGRSRGATISGLRAKSANLLSNTEFGPELTSSCICVTLHEGLLFEPLVASSFRALTQKTSFQSSLSSVNFIPTTVQFSCKRLADVLGLVPQYKYLRRVMAKHLDVDDNGKQREWTDLFV